MILQKVIATHEAEILVIGGLPEDAHNFRMHKEDLHYDCLFAPDPFNLPLGKWQPLGFLKDIQEDVAKELVDDEYRFFPEEHLIFRNYTKPLVHPLFNSFPFIAKKWEQTWNDPFGSATESLHSLIENNCKLKNKYGKTPKSEDFGSFSRFREMFDVWQEEQSRVFTNPFLLKKV